MSRIKYLQTPNLPKTPIGEETSIVTDNTLTVEGDAADAKVTGDRLRALEHMGEAVDIVTTLNADELTWEQGSISDRGVDDASNYCIRTVGYFTDVIPGTDVTYTGALANDNGDNYVCQIVQYNSSGGFISRNLLAASGTVSTVTLSSSCAKVRFYLGHNKSTGVYTDLSESPKFRASYITQTTSGTDVTDRIKALEDELDIPETDEYESAAEVEVELSSWVLAGFIDGNGNYSTSNPTAACATEYVPVAPGTTFKRPGEGYDENNIIISICVHEYSSTNTWLRRTYFPAGVTDPTITVGADCAVVRFAINRAASTGVTMTNSDIDTYFHVYRIVEHSPLEQLSRLDKIENTQIRNTMKLALAGAKNAVQRRARLFTDVQWTALAAAPRFLVSGSTWTKTAWPAGTKITGIPYASQTRYELWVGRNVSFESFVTAAANPNSVIYNFARQSDNTLYHPGCWYSIVCSQLALVVIGVETSNTTEQMKNIPGMTQVANAGGYTAEDIHFGDILVKEDEHTAIITDLIKSTFGKLIQIEVSEAVTPSCRRKKWNLEGNVDNFWDHWGAYKLLRFSGINDVQDIDVETLIPYISETLGLNHGNRANYLSGDSVKLTLFAKPSGTLNVTLNGVSAGTIDVSNKHVGDVITLEAAAAGYYSVNFDGGAAKDAVEFYRDDSVVSYSSGTVTFSSTYGKITRIAFASSGNRSHVGTDVYLTDADRLSGNVAVTKPSSTAYIHAFFETQFGSLCIEVAV